MPRLTRSAHSSARRDRGAAATWVALLMIPMLVIAALGIDVGAMHADRQRLQTGADAAALAVAQQCAVASPPCTTSSASTTAQQLATANDPMVDDATATVTTLTSGYVEVETTSEREHWFATVIGVDSTDLTAESAAAWGYPTGGPAVMPLAYHHCELMAQTGNRITPIRSGSTIIGLNVPTSGVATTIYSTKSSQACPPQSGNFTPGGFGWLASAICNATTTSLDQWYRVSTGNTPPRSCENALFRSYVGQTIFLPVFDVYRGTGNNAEYQIFGYIAFQLSGYNFGGQYQYPPASPPCRGNDRCISGTFLRYADLDSTFTVSPTGPQLGAVSVGLTLPRETP